VVKRREFIAVVGGAAAVWPLSAYAQQRSATRHVGVFLGLSTGPEDPGAAEILRPLRTSMQESGWIEGRNVRFDVRFGGGELIKIGAAADELVALAPELIYATGFPPVQALRQRTRTIPIVFSLVADPVGFGLIESLSRPGGNITGFVVWDLSIGGKWIQLLQEVAPNVRRIGIMYNPNTAPYAPPLIASARASATAGVAVAEYHARNDSEIEGAATSLANPQDGGLLVIPEPFTNANRDKIIAQSDRFRVPTLNPVFGAVRRGALISYTYAFDVMMRQPANYIDRILKGESPSNLPVQAPTKYVLSINLKAAKVLGLSVPPTLLGLADEVVE
jgi:putative tryptophan/tyrosine transport system substrate-binding protein